MISSSVFLKLPHLSTLSKYTSFTDIMTGFNPDIIERLVTEIKLTEMKDHERNCSLLFDEMKIKSGLVLSRATGKLIGFTEIGDINDELLEFERKFSGKERDLATHILAFMARGIFSHFNFPIGYFCSKGFNSDQLFPCVWEAIGVLESTGLKVRACICDGATPNRRFFKLHAMENSENISNVGVVYCAVNRFHFQRKVYFISDPLHLIKTLRNNIENSHGHNNTRNLMVNGESLSWQHIISVCEWDLGMHRHAFGLRKLPKLTEDHVSLSPRLRMRVNFAKNQGVNVFKEYLKYQK